MPEMGLDQDQRSYIGKGRKESIMKYLGRYNYDKMLAWERDFAERLVICPVYDSSGFTCIGYDLYYI